MRFLTQNKNHQYRQRKIINTGNMDDELTDYLFYRWNFAGGRES